MYHIGGSTVLLIVVVSYNAHKFSTGYTSTYFDNSIDGLR